MTRSTRLFHGPLSRRHALLLLGGATLAAACSSPPEPGLPPAPPPTPVVHAPVTFPRDEAPHSDLTEWWYYTGHLEAADGRRWGYELVTFQILRATLEPFYVGHFAITDEARKQFRYEDRSVFGRQQQPPEGFALNVGGWQMRGLLGNDSLTAAMPEYAIDLKLTTRRPPVLHDGGLVTFGPAGDSYYYSRTRMEIDGTLEDHGERIPVRGLSWFDKQWGNFLVMGGGWDWFSLQLEDGTDLMLNLIRDAVGRTTIAYGTLVTPDGAFQHLPAGSFEVTPLATWTSPHTGIIYPSGWRASVHSADLDLRVSPVIPDQELDTRTTTGMVYWEGSQDVVGTRKGQPVGGQGYVELVGYTS